MSRLRSLIFLSCLLVAFAGCGDDEGDDLSGNTSSTQPANSAAAQRPASTGPKLSEQETALMIAAAKGDTATVKAMLDAGVKVDTRDPDGNATALCHAAWFGHADTAQLLIERGADVNAKKSDGTSVLRLATVRGHNDLAEKLKKAGAQ
jgi:ankyrin repeat protein